MGANAGQTSLGLLKGGLTGVGQGLQQQGNPNPQFNFNQLQQGFQNARKKPALGQGITPGASGGSGFSANPFWGGDQNINGGYYT